ncbi:MAG: hypothetical protein ACK55I_04670, partial [bacterium]
VAGPVQHRTHQPEDHQRLRHPRSVERRAEFLELSVSSRSFALFRSFLAWAARREAAVRLARRLLRRST